METGGVLIIADETGIGKGRQAAAVIQYAKNNGKIPVFFTTDAKLFSDMYYDMQDVGGSLKPLLLGSANIVDKNSKVKVKRPRTPATQRKGLPAHRALFR